MERSSSSKSNSSFAEAFEKEREKEKLSKKERKAEKKGLERDEKERKKAEKEAACLAALKERLSKLRNSDLQSPAPDSEPLKMPSTMDSDPELLRFVKARKADVDKTYEMVVKCAIWRNTYKPDQIDPTTVRREAESGKAFLLGPDKEGHTTWLVLPGRHNPKEADNDEVIRALCHFVEDSRAKLPDGIPKELNLILDFEGWGSKNVDHGLDKRMFDMLQCYYPEVLHRAILLHPPAHFKLAWVVIKPWLDKRTQDKIRMLSASDTPKVLMELFDSSVIPVKYGGTNSMDLTPGGVSLLGSQSAPAALSMTR
jgi:hypothetical protein